MSRTARDFGKVNFTKLKMIIMMMYLLVQLVIYTSKRFSIHRQIHKWKKRTHTYTHTEN